MRNVLVLNASFEPLSVVSARRAACLVLADKAEIIESGEELVRSPSFAMNVPLVVRLRYMVKAPTTTGRAVSPSGFCSRRLPVPVLRDSC